MLRNCIKRFNQVPISRLLRTPNPIRFYTTETTNPILTNNDQSSLNTIVDIKSLLANKKCIKCNSEFQFDLTNQPGYVKPTITKEVFKCSPCLRKPNLLVKSDIRKTNHTNLQSLQHINAPLIVMVIDALDIQNTVFSNIQKVIKRDQKLLILVNNYNQLNVMHHAKDFKDFVHRALFRAGYSQSIKNLKYVNEFTLPKVIGAIQANCQSGDDVAFVGCGGSGVRSLINNLYKDNKYTSTIVEFPELLKGKYPKTIKYTPSKSVDGTDDGFKFNALEITGIKNTESFIPKLSYAQRRTFIPHTTPIRSYTSSLLPNHSYFLSGFVRIDYEGTHPLHITNFTHINQKILTQDQTQEEFPKLIKGESTAVLNDRKLPNNLPRLYYSRTVELPFHFKHSSDLDTAPFKMDISLNGLGWVSLNTSELDKNGGSGKLHIYTWPGIKLPISRPRYPHWNSRFVKEGESNDTTTEAVTTEATESIESKSD